MKVIRIQTMICLPFAVSKFRFHQKDFYNGTFQIAELNN